MIDQIDSRDPATGRLVATFPADDDAAVRAVVGAARTAADWWAALGFEGRRRRLTAWRRAITRDLDGLAELVHRENGKPVADALLEIVLAVEHIAWAAAQAPEVLRHRRVAPGWLMLNQAASVVYEPYGVVGVLGPWNYPVFTPMGSLAYALAAGNAVVYKPSEHTPAVGRWLVERFAEVVPEQPVLSLVTGAGDTGVALCRAGVDKLAFTGSAATARKVMAVCAESLTPVLLECGGKDALVVDADADVPAAVEAALWGGLSNAGQTCIGIERVYAVEAVYPEFVAALTRRAGEIKAGADYGPITVAEQAEVVSRHVADALERGARAVVGGVPSPSSPWIEPVLLVDVPEEALAVTEETFGPTLTVTRVRDADEAVARVNASRYGLGAAVFGTARAADIAARLRCGMVSINSVIAFAGVPALPFGGVGDSGFGRIHGADGLREFARPKAVTRQRFAPVLALTTFRRRPAAVRATVGLARLVHGRR
ncbi:MAG: aldehyde dehydrogenase family protein [Actinomycetota bacterium]|nr:aldehyde dehydrogenase family protein [Actinomycetota bacterium]